MSVIIKKLLGIIILPIICTSLIFSQSLAELAKKEKERREKLKGIEVTFVTNADLKKFQKSKASIVNKTKNPTTAKSNTPIPPLQIPVKLPLKAKSGEQNKNEQESELENKIRKANDLVGLLNLKMRALWQHFYSTNNLVPKNQIQQQISQTYLQLQKAQHDLEILKKKTNTRKKI